MANRFSIEAVFKAVDRVTAPVSRMQSRVSRMTRGLNRSMQRLNRTVNTTISKMRTAGSVAGKILGAGVLAVGGALTFASRQFSKIEDAEASFTPLMGGVKEAKKLVDELNKTAASTPFQFENIADAANQLLPVMSKDINRTIKTFRMLGDTAGGNVQKLESITRGFVKAMLKNKVDMESLNMIAEAGVPIFTELANTMGTKVNAAFFKMISAGKVTTKQLTQTFEKMTKEGGIFFKGMEIASKTQTGVMSTMRDNLSLTAAALGKIFAPTIKMVTMRITELFQRIKKIIEANEELIASKFQKFMSEAAKAVRRIIDALRRLHNEIDFFKLAMRVLRAVAKTFEFLVKWRKPIMILAGVIGSLTILLKVFIGVMAVVNAVMAANPITWIVLGVVALIAAIASVIIWWEKLKDLFLGLPKWAQIALAAINWPIAALIIGANLVMKAWEPIKKLFGFISDKFSKVTSKVGGFFGFGKENERESTNATPDFIPQVVSPQDRVARSIEEKRTRAEVTIKDETGRAALTKGILGPGLNLQPSGAF